ncbi:MAG: hypothetical protein MJZ13_10635 [Bacteroidales bacterium]|nr:hypothetical protein [Bacteroidales bacterium]
MGNFEYIKQLGLQNIYEPCAKAEEAQEANPKEAAENCKRAIEEVCKLVVAKTGIECSGDLSTMLDNEALASALTDMDIYRQIRQVRKRSNMAINLGEDLEGLPYVVELLFHIVGAALVSFDYIKKIPDYISETDHWEIPEDGM